MFGWSDKKGGTRKAGCRLSSESLAWLMLDSKEAYLERVVAKISVTCDSFFLKTMASVISRLCSPCVSEGRQNHKGTSLLESCSQCSLLSVHSVYEPA